MPPRTRKKGPGAQAKRDLRRFGTLPDLSEASPEDRTCEFSKSRVETSKSSPEARPPESESSPEDNICSIVDEISDILDERRLRLEDFEIEGPWSGPTSGFLDTPYRPQDSSYVQIPQSSSSEQMPAADILKRRHSLPPVSQELFDFEASSHLSLHPEPSEASSSQAPLASSTLNSADASSSSSYVKPPIDLTLKKRRVLASVSQKQVDLEASSQLRLRSESSRASANQAPLVSSTSKIEEGPASRRRSPKEYADQRIANLARLELERLRHERVEEKKSDKEDAIARRLKNKQERELSQKEEKRLKAEEKRLKSETKEKEELENKTKKEKEKELKKKKREIDDKQKANQKRKEFSDYSDTSDGSDVAEADADLIAVGSGGLRWAEIGNTKGRYQNFLITWCERKNDARARIAKLETASLPASSLLKRLLERRRENALEESKISIPGEHLKYFEEKVGLENPSSSRGIAKEKRRADDIMYADPLWSAYLQQVGVSDDQEKEIFKSIELKESRLLSKNPTLKMTPLPDNKNEAQTLMMDAARAALATMAEKQAAKDLTLPLGIEPPSRQRIDVADIMVAVAEEETSCRHMHWAWMCPHASRFGRFLKKEMHKRGIIIDVRVDRAADSADSAAFMLSYISVPTITKPLIDPFLSFTRNLSLKDKTNRILERRRQQTTKPLRATEAASIIQFLKVDSYDELVAVAFSKIDCKERSLPEFMRTRLTKWIDEQGAEARAEIEHFIERRKTLETDLSKYTLPGAIANGLNQTCRCPEVTKQSIGFVEKRLHALVENYYYDSGDESDPLLPSPIIPERKVRSRPQKQVFSDKSPPRRRWKFSTGHETPERPRNRRSRRGEKSKESSTSDPFAVLWAFIRMLIFFPQALRTDKKRNILLIGISDAGKSALIRVLLSFIPPSLIVWIDPNEKTNWLADMIGKKGAIICVCEEFNIPAEIQASSFNNVLDGGTFTIRALHRSISGVERSPPFLLGSNDLKAKDSRQSMKALEGFFGRLELLQMREAVEASVDIQTDFRRCLQRCNRCKASFLSSRIRKSKEEFIKEHFKQVGREIHVMGAENGEGVRPCYANINFDEYDPSTGCLRV